LHGVGADHQIGRSLPRKAPDSVQGGISVAAATISSKVNHLQDFGRPPAGENVAGRRLLSWKSALRGGEVHATMSSTVRQFTLLSYIGR
jgi:hypothetical protein